ncbi:unnamed protein product [Kuraishia capsulata CBS 1993]|uniref:DNA damage checkpoint control protein RAD17 n=1 Tax=Kuraishia capsulata CBS 1993 TaxID=1382522 RepID=W6MLQ5_9ASCO|nr:uncharacterized protein KUCA_T00003025001 [Kuraishia capsulata CBS 1993]CDK27048.1 unnamed protein product [Kuraishia capsulata CBS 1993]
MSYDDRVLFSATTNALSHFADLVNAIAVTNSTMEVLVTPRGLMFKTTERGVFEISTLLEPGFFKNFDLITTDQPIRVFLDMDSFIESVNLANTMAAASESSGETVQCTFSYHHIGDPFIVTFEDDQILERVEFMIISDTGLENEDSTDSAITGENQGDYFQIDPSRLCLDMMLDSAMLYGILKDLKEVKTEQIYLYCAIEDDNPRVVFVSKGEVGYSRMTLPNINNALKEMAIYRDERPTTEDSVSTFYSFESFSKILRTASLATTIKFKIDTDGRTVMSLLITNTKSSITTVIEFKVLQTSDLNHDASMINNTFMTRLVSKEQKVSTSRHSNTAGTQLETLVNVERAQHRRTESGQDLPLFL